MAGMRRRQTRKNGGAGSRQASSSRSQPPASGNDTKVYAVCTHETALALFGPGGTLYNPRIEAFFRSLEQIRFGRYNSPAEREAAVQEVYRQHDEALAEWEIIKQKGAELKALWNNEKDRLLTAPIDDLSLDETMEATSMLDEVKQKLMDHLARVSAEPSRPAESRSSNDAESSERSASATSAGNESGDADEDNGAEGKN